MKSNHSGASDSKSPKGAISVANESAEDLLQQGRELENAVLSLVRAGALSHRNPKRPELDQRKTAVLRWFNQVHVCLKGTLTYNKSRLWEASQRVWRFCDTHREDQFGNMDLFQESMHVAFEMLSVHPQMVGTTDALPRMPDASGSDSTSQSRKRGPKPDFDTAARIAEIVRSVAPKGDWQSKLDDVCEALDEEKIPPPATWPQDEPPCRNWSGQIDRQKGIKAIKYRLQTAKKAAPETLS
jgi:hypothetical protein